MTSNTNTERHVQRGGRVDIVRKRMFLFVFWKDIEYSQKTQIPIYNMQCTIVCP